MPCWCFLIFWNWLLFFCTFLLCVGQERNEIITFIFPLSQSFPTNFGLKWSDKGIFLIFLLLFRNFLLRLGYGRNGTIIFIFSLSWSFPTYVGLKWGSNGIFNFLNFFTVFLEFSITGHVGTNRNDNFYFLSFFAFFKLFWLEKMPWWCFLTFWNCFLFFCSFLLCVGQERNEMITFIFSLSKSFPT